MINMDYKIQYCGFVNSPKIDWNPDQNHNRFFGKKEHADSIVYMKIERFYKSQKKNKVGEFFIILFQDIYKVTVIKVVSYWHKDRYIENWIIAYRIHKWIHTHTSHHLIWGKNAETIQWVNNVFYPKNGAGIIG